MILPKATIAAQFEFNETAKMRLIYKLPEYLLRSYSPCKASAKFRAEV
jgi:hypothetical protein